MAKGKKRGRGIYLLPNLLTTAALFAGFYAIVAAIVGRYVPAAMAIFVAGILDGLDGRIARLTNTQSEFGVQYDSMSDMVSFGVAPAVIVYAWSLSSMGELGNVWGKVGWLAAFLYAACAALRLARFNAQSGVADKEYFQGLASPAAAGLLASMVWVAEDFGLSGEALRTPTLLVTLLAAGLMVSKVRYFSFKSIAVKDKVPFVAMLLLVLIFVLLAIDTPKVLFGVAVVYLLSGPVMTLFGIYRQRGRRRSAREKS